MLKEQRKIRPQGEGGEMGSETKRHFMSAGERTKQGLQEGKVGGDI